MSKTNRKYFKKTNKYLSSKFSGWDHFRTKPFGLKGWNYYYKKDREGKLTEDVYSEINNKSIRQKLKQELKNELL